MAVATGLLFLSGLALYGAMLVLPLYWQELRGADALGAGVLLIPQGVGTLISRTIAGDLTDRFGARWVTLAGFAVTALATVPFATVGASGSTWALLVSLFVRGFGLGAITIPLMAAAYVGLSGNDVPHASVITRIGSQVGGSVGVAVLAVIFTHALAGGVEHGYDVAFWSATGFALLGVPLPLLLPGMGRASGQRGA